VGYLPLPAEAAAALFQVVSQRYLKGSIALTTKKLRREVQDSLGAPQSRREQLTLMTEAAYQL